MELKSTAQITRKNTISVVFQYSRPKGRESMASLKLSSIHLAGKMITGSTATLSATVLELVRIIHAKGNTMISAPRTRKK